MKKMVPPDQNSMENWSIVRPKYSGEDQFSSDSPDVLQYSYLTCQVSCTIGLPTDIFFNMNNANMSHEKAGRAALKFTFLIAMIFYIRTTSMFVFYMLVIICSINSISRMRKCQKENG